MSYYQHHVFFCTNQRANGERCCNDHHAQEMRDYAKARIKSLKLSGKNKIRINNAGCLDRCSEGPVIVIYRKKSGTPTLIRKISMKLSNPTCRMERLWSD